MTSMEDQTLEGSFHQPSDKIILQRKGRAYKSQKGSLRSVYKWHGYLLIILEQEYKFESILRA